MMIGSKFEEISDRFHKLCPSYNKSNPCVTFHNMLFSYCKKLLSPSPNSQASGPLHNTFMSKFTFCFKQKTASIPQS